MTNRKLFDSEEDYQEYLKAEKELLKSEQIELFSPENMPEIKGVKDEDEISISK